MGRNAWLLLAAAGIGMLPHAARAEDPPAPKGPRPPVLLDADLERKVDAAIDRGVKWLLSRQAGGGWFGNRPVERDLPPRGKTGEPPLPPGFVVKVEGSLRAVRLGECALVLYALRACGVPAAERHVKKGFQWAREEYVELRDMGRLENYAVSLLLLALEAHGNPPEDPDPVDGRYGRSARRNAPIPAEDLAWMKELTAWLVRAQNSDGGFSYLSPGIPQFYDHSNSQFSLLALKAARRCGIPVPRELWVRSLEMFLRNQEATGPDVLRREPMDPGGQEYGMRTGAGRRDRARGWGYDSRAPATGSMTGAGVSSLVICRSELLGTPGYDAALDGRAEQGIRDGLAWLGLHFSVEENPGPADAPMMAKSWQYYWLYGLERAGVLAAVEQVGDHAWYPVGADYLVREQEKGGWWEQKGRFRLAGLPPDLQRQVDGLADHRTGDIDDTCFALLFLKRATHPVERGSVATEAAADSLDLSGAAALDDAAFRDLFDLVFRKFATAEPVERQARSADFVRMGTRALPLLVLRLESEEEGQRGAAIDALRMITGETRGFDAAAPEESRSAAVRAWEEWWFAKGRTLVPDVEGGRFREESE